MQILDNDTKKVGNKVIQKWYKDCGPVAVVVSILCSVFCYTYWIENRDLKKQIVTERNEHTADLRDNTLFIQTLLKK